MADLLTVEDAAAELGTPVRFVRRLIHERRIRFHKLGKYVRIARQDLDEFIRAGAVHPASGTSLTAEVGTNRRSFGGY